MTRAIICLTLATLVLASCGSRWNPFNWFDRSEPVQTGNVDENSNPLIPEQSGTIVSFLGNSNAKEVDSTTPISSITDLVIERVPGGAIIRATGLDPTQGAFNVNISPVDEDEEADENGVLLYELKRDRPPFRTASGPAQTREVTAARFVSDQTLAGVRTIRVTAATNARESRRR